MCVCVQNSKSRCEKKKRKRPCRTRAEQPLWSFGSRYCLDIILADDVNKVTVASSAFSNVCFSCVSECSLEKLQ